MKSITFLAVIGAAAALSLKDITEDQKSAVLSEDLGGEFAAGVGKKTPEERQAEKDKREAEKQAKKDKKEADEKADEMKDNAELALAQEEVAEVDKKHEGEEAEKEADEMKDNAAHSDEQALV